MDSKMTRRAVLGTIIAGLTVGPFVMYALRKKRTTSLDSRFDFYQKQMIERLSFPREFDVNSGIGTVSSDWPSPPPEKIRDKIFATQKRFWKNYSKLDELKFVFSSPRYFNGKLEPSSNEFFDTEVYIKFGYGVEVKGKNTLGKKVHLVFNIDGEDNQPPAEDPNRCNLVGFPHCVFSLGESHPVYAKRYTSIEENVHLPSCFQRTYSHNNILCNFDTDSEGFYTQLKGPYDSLVNAKAFRKCYFSQKTGMLELTLLESVIEDFECDDTPLCNAYICREVNGLYFPIKSKGGKIYKGNVYSWEEEYSDINFKLIS